MFQKNLISSNLQIIKGWFDCVLAVEGDRLTIDNLPISKIDNKQNHNTVPLIDLVQLKPSFPIPIGMFQVSSSHTIPNIRKIREIIDSKLLDVVSEQKKYYFLKTVWCYENNMKVFIQMVL